MGIRTYNEVIRELTASHDLTHRQAQIAWRGIRDRVGHAPTLPEIVKRRRITAEEAQRAPARERAIRAAATRTARRIEAAQAAMDLAARRRAAALKGHETRKAKAERKRIEDAARAGGQHWGGVNVEGLRRYVPKHAPLKGRRKKYVRSS